jgi:uncharacterized protein (TIGR02646 family)
MRRINLKPPDTPKWKAWLRKCKAETTKLQTLVDQGQKITTKDIKHDLYKRYKEFFFDEYNPFQRKCAYCESAVDVSQFGDVEHFRPKLKVTDEKDNEIRHPGYYWLAYDWQNLLISCIKCNQATGKYNRFPVIGTHAQSPAEIANEKPLLINSTSSNDEDDPSKHLEVEVQDSKKYISGRIFGHTERGEMCIEVMNLNRLRLIEERCAAIRESILLRESLALQVKAGAIDKQTIEDIRAVLQGKRPYSSVRHLILAKKLSELGFQS